MAFYVRKISPGKWPRKGEGGSVAAIRADAITGDLRTTGDTISLWRIESPADLNQAVLALATGNDKAATHNVLLISEESLQKCGFILAEHEGNTPLEAMVKEHRDIVNVNYDSLGKLAQLIIEAINAGKMYTITRKPLLGMIVDAYKNGEINRDKLKEEMLKEIERELEKETG